ncbi:radical SAM protein [Rhodocyclus tenuis]|uniref:Radical SAM protein n=1 Tax=Rhodocyclus gracilis TaxID=2929842 RepID=A0ABX0WE74_9RHOO|nr:radical SAM protein [Rhodocyclus gracilis]NJA88032.1 radical SAM protein [Rhodocyclus gracilis]
MLTIVDHRRDSAGLRYVYPVVSRRAGGVSIGINLNPNAACNWACRYCQVPNLQRGGPPALDLPRLESELRGFLHDVVHGDFMARCVPAESRRLVDVAFSGDGEPTTAPEFADAVVGVASVLGDLGLVDSLRLRLITNGSQVHRPAVRAGIARIGELEGEVWFKIDRATTQGVLQVNRVRRTPAQMHAALLDCAELAPTWLQTCWFAMDGEAPDADEEAAYLAWVQQAVAKIKGVHLYGLARPSQQPDAARLSPLSAASFSAFAQKIAALGIEVVANP